MILGKHEVMILASLSLSTINLLIARTMFPWHLASLILAVGFFRDVWLLLLVEYICLDMYSKLDRNPYRTLNLNLLMVSTWVVHSYRHELRLPDFVKTHCFFFAWSLLAIYVKNKLLLLYTMLKEEGKATR